MPEYDYERHRKIDRSVKTAKTNLKKARTLLAEAHADGLHVMQNDAYELLGEALETAAQLIRIIPDKHFYYDTVGTLSWGFFAGRDSDYGVRIINEAWAERRKITDLKKRADKLANVTVANGATSEEEANAQRQLAKIDLEQYK